jgi:hypothetical protein
MEGSCHPPRRASAEASEFNEELNERDASDKKHHSKIFLFGAGKKILNSNVNHNTLHKQGIFLILPKKEKGRQQYAGRVKQPGFGNHIGETHDRNRQQHRFERRLLLPVNESRQSDRSEENLTKQVSGGERHGNQSVALRHRGAEFLRQFILKIASSNLKPQAQRLLDIITENPFQ